jgi:hypothetical protein
MGGAIGGDNPSAGAMDQLAVTRSLVGPATDSFNAKHGTDEGGAATEAVAPPFAHPTAGF